MRTLNEELEAVKDDDTIIGAKPPKVRTLFDVVKTGNYSLEDFKKSKELVAPEYESDMSTRIRAGLSRGVQDIKNIPQNVEIFGGQVEMAIGGWAGSEEKVERGRSLIQTAKGELDAKEKAYYQSAIPMSSKDYESLSFGVGQGIVNYGSMLATGYLGGEIAGLASMAVLEGGQKAQEKIDYYTERTGDTELKGYTPQQAGKDALLTAIYETGSTILEKKLGYGQQRRLFKMPIGKKIRNVALTSLSEGGTETIQELYATGIDLAGGYIDTSKLPERFIGAVKEGVIGGILGGTAGIAAAVNHRSQAKQILREELKNTVPEKDLDNVVDAIYESTSDSMSNIITQELAQSEQLRNKHGAIYESLKSEVTKQIKDSGAYSDVDEMKLSQYIEGTAKMFADQVLGEANNRGVVIDDVMKSSEIVYRDGRLYLQGASEQTKVKRARERASKTPSLLQFIRLRGGVIDEGGELKDMDASKSFVGLVNKNGTSLDSMGEALWEAGYFQNRPTTSEVLELIDDELRGNKHYPLGDIRTTDVSQVENEAMLDNALYDYADIMGYDLGKMSYDEKVQAYDQMQRNLNASDEMVYGEESPAAIAEDIFDLSYFQVADENQRLDDIYPAYEGETITINGQEKTVYNSNGDRIAKSKEALENFYRWFGDSKVVDEQGRPKVMYHGTPNAIYDTLQAGTYFTDNKDYAEVYKGQGASSISYKKEAQKPGVYAVYLKMEKPFDTRNKEARDDFYKYYYQQMGMGTDLTERGLPDWMDGRDLLDFITEEHPELGYDGLILDEGGVGGYGEPVVSRGFSYVTARDDQVKSTSNRGTYSESENIYYQENDDRGLVALHTISASNLEKAIDFGGFPVPSIAIVKKGQEFHFDDLPITLVGNKEMIDPYDERNEVYNRDVWTKTFPWVTYKKPTQAKEKSFKNKIEEYYKRTNSENELGSFIYVAQRGDTSSALSQFQSSSGAMLYYLENIKRQKVEFAEKDLASDILERAGIDETLANEIQGLDVDTDRDKITKAFKRFLDRKEEEEFSDIKDAEKREKMIKFSRKLANENYFDKEGNLYFAKADTIVTASDRYFSSKGKKFIDQYEVRRQLRDMVANDEDYREWSTEFFEKELVGDKMVRVGNALKPFTLENVVDAMTTGATVASQETPLPAMGKVIAAGAKRLESIRDIKEEGRKLVTLEQSKENMEKVKETLYDFLNMFEKGDDFSRNMDRKDAVATALQGVLKNKNITKESLKKAILRQLPSDKTVSDEVLSYGVELANEIKGLARYYFEAKPQRAVGLNEFSAAIMPTSAEFDAIAKKVEDAGLRVVRSDNQTEALQEIDTEDNVFFQSAFHGSPNKELEGGKFDLKYAGKTTGNVHGHGVYAVVSKPSAEYWAGENGQVYELDVPEDFELIDEQKGFDEQSEKVRYAILGALEKINGFGLLEKAVLDNMPGGEIYVALGKDVFFDKHGYEGGSTEIMKAASEFLDKLGIKGITYDYANEKNFVIFNPDNVKVLQKFYQVKNLPKQKGKIKGAFDALTKSIEITSEADFSTYQHEMAHYWLDNIWNYAQSGKASPEYMKRFNEIKKWLGVKGDYPTRTQHEKFARAYEKYLYRGEYANPIIGDTFKEYEDFIREVYDSIAEIDTRAGVKYKPVPKLVYDFFNSMVSGTLPYYGGIDEPKEVVEKETKEVKEFVKEEQKVLAENTQNYILKPVQTDTETGYLTAYKKMTGEQVEAGVVNLEKEQAKAEKFVSENPELAKQIVDGVAPVPEGMLKNTIYLAYDKLQKRLGNTQNRVNSLMNQALELRRMGQEISSQRLAYSDETSPLYWIQTIQDNKANALADANKMKVKELNNLIKKSITNGMKQGKTAKEIAKELREQLGVTEFYQEEVYPTEETEQASYNYIYKYVNQQLGLGMTMEEAETITRKADDMLSALENSKAPNGNPSVDYFVKQKDLENYANSVAPSSQARVLVSVVGRGNLLFSIKSPLTNVVSNAFVGAYRAAVRRIMLKTNESIVSPELIKQNKQYSWEIFRKTGYNVNNITPETPRNTILGEKLTHSEGEGNIRRLGRFYENLIYKWSLGAGDVIFKDYAFTDYVALRATKESGGDVIKANEIFKDACLIEPQTELGQEIRNEAIQESLIATYQNQGLISEKALKARSAMDFGVGFGEFIAPFVKTPANVVSMGLKAGFGSVKAVASEIQRDLKAGKIQKPTRENIELVVQNGLGVLVAALLLGAIDDEDYMPPYALATNKDKQLAKELNIGYNAIRIGNTWVSLDYLGPLASPLVGLLQARREDGALNSVFGYTKSGMIQSLSIPAFGNISDIFTNIQNTVRKDGADVAKQTLDDTIQAVYARTVPSIVSDVAKMLDMYDRETKGHEIQAKIPFAREQLPKKVNVTSGRAESLDNPIQELLFGARAKTQVVNSVANELQRLNAAGYGVSLTPVTQRGLLSDLDENTKDKVRQDFAKEYSKQVGALIKSPKYKKMDDEDKQQSIDKIRRKTVESLKKRYLKK